MEKLILILEKMHFDELSDWMDYVEYHYLTSSEDIDARKLLNQRRKGKAGGFLDNSLIMTTLHQKSALKAFQSASKPEKRTIFTVAQALQRAKQPRIARENAQGTIQLKWRNVPERHLSGKPVLDADGNPIVRTFGPYLYLRVWATGGDSGDKKRLKSIYIGGTLQASERLKGKYPYRELAQAFDETYERTESGRRIQTAATKALMQQILDCIQLHPTDPIINHDALEQLQFQITQYSDIT